ncbi:MAG: hypothetical protein ABJA34_00555 [Pseudonocardiales bacterium]
MLVAVAVCPHPPLLVPAVAAGAAPELASLRSACATAIGRLSATAADVVVLVGAAPTVRWYNRGDAGSFQSYGVPVEVALDTEIIGLPTMPLSLTVGGWLLNVAGWPGRRRALGVPGHVAEAHLGRLAGEVTGAAARVALLVMGDGSARHTVQAPGYLDERAPDFDQAVATALASADTDALSALDQQLGDDLLAAGTAAWRLLGCAAAGAAWDAELIEATAPYGVGYLVASWQRRP